MEYNEVSQEVFSLMQTGTPLKRYKKTILGKVFVTVLNPFSRKPEGIILSGDPRKNERSCFVEVWSPAEEMFFIRSNAKHLDDGTLTVWGEIEEQQEVEKKLSEYTDDDIAEIVNKYLKLRRIVEKTKSEAFLYRLLTKAEELERPEKTLNLIRQKIKEVQNA